VLGRRSAVLYLATIAVAAIGSGLLLDAVVKVLPAPMPMSMTHEHEMGGTWLSVFWSLVLIGVIAYSYFARPHETAEHDHAHEGHGHDSGATPHEKIELSIDGMSCGHCAAAVAKALKACRGVKTANVDLASRRATISGDGLDQRELLSTVDALGYHAALG
jgi:copper chaperone CopZ